MTESEYRTFLATRRANLREMYARFREYGSKMRQKGLVVWSDDRGGYYTQSLWDRPGKDRVSIQMLLNLQRNIKDQAMLLLELEHAVDCAKNKLK